MSKDSESKLKISFIAPDPSLDEDLINNRLCPIIVKPNLGQPQFLFPNNLNIDESIVLDLPEVENLKFEFDALLAVCKSAKIDEIIDAIDNRVFIYPLSEELTNGRALRFARIPVIVKEFKPTKILSIENEEYCGQPQEYLHSEKAFPGRDQYFFIKCQFSIPSNFFYRFDVKTNQKTLRRSILCDIVYDLTHETIFNIESADNNYVHQYLDEYNEKTGADIERLMKINYHSLVLLLKNKDFTSNLHFWHASDLHITKRNDIIPHIVFNQMKTEGIREIDVENGKINKIDFENYLKNSYNSDEDLSKINDRIENKSCFAYKLDYDPIFKNEMHNYYNNDYFWNLPVEYRVQNYNNNLRMLIYEANEAYKKKNLDFIIFSGDLVDFVTPHNAKNYHFKHSNWKAFIDIILGKPHKVGLDNGLLTPEEVLVPIFTIPGNHDYRGHSYPPTTAYSSKNFGLKNEELKLYPETGRFSGLKSLYSNIKYLRGYFQFINPDLNYSIKIGNFHLLFLDSDKDSILDLYDLLKGSPSTKGFRDSQLKYLRRYCDNNLLDNEEIIIITHAPPINPPKINTIKDKLRKVFNISKDDEDDPEKKPKFEMLKEYSLIRVIDDPRIDPFINLKFGTIIKNWEEMLNFFLSCKSNGVNRRVKLVLAGHSHENLEFRLQTLQGRDLSKTPYVEYWPFKKLRIPCAVYYGNYSAEYQEEIKYLNKLQNGEQIRRLSNTHLITNKYPFLVETTSLGPRSPTTHDRSNIQAYREIIIKNNRLESFGLKPLIKYFAPFDVISGEKCLVEIEKDDVNIDEIMEKYFGKFEKDIVDE